MQILSKNSIAGLDGCDDNYGILRSCSIIYDKYNYHINSSHLVKHSGFSTTKDIIFFINHRVYYTF